MTWVVVFVVLCCIEGVHEALKLRFGPDVWQGIKLYRAGREPDFITAHGAEPLVSQDPTLHEIPHYLHEPHDLPSLLDERLHSE